MCATRDSDSTICKSVCPTAFHLLVAAGLLVSVGCAPVECPSGTTESNARCVRVASDSGASMAGDEGVAASPSSAAGSSGGAAASEGTPAIPTGDPNGGASGDGASGSVTSADGGSGQGVSNPSCAPEGSLRCGVQSNTAIESCVGETWTLMQECPVGQACASPSPGEAECTVEAVACDGLMCNGECVPNDERNCGTCGHDCTGLPNVVGPTTCQAGVCAFEEASCEVGYAHCSDDPEDGCEARLSDVKTCGGCDVECPATEPVCAVEPGTDKYACGTGCSEDAPALCGMSCVNPMADAAHCGGCDMACPAVANGQPVCMAGMCTKKCNSGYHLCSDECVSDRSTDSCGQECSPCDAPTGARATCDGTRCGFECTNRSALKCDNGCFPSDDRNCGSCGNDCRANGEVCDGRTCVECRSNSDCGGSTRYCVDNECKECEPGNSSACGDCETCSSSGTCVAMGTSEVCYTDADGDGYGGRTSPQSVCGDCPSGTVTDNRDCYDSNDGKGPDVRPGQSTYFETGYGPGESNFDYDCNGREEKQSNSPQLTGIAETACVCTSNGTCGTETPGPVDCGARGNQCTGGAGEMCSCYLAVSWTVQACR